MWKAFISCWKVPEIKRRILITAGILILCRLAANIPCPGIDVKQLEQAFKLMANNKDSDAAAAVADNKSSFVVTAQQLSDNKNHTDKSIKQKFWRSVSYALFGDYRYYSTLQKAGYLLLKMLIQMEVWYRIYHETNI